VRDSEWSIFWQAMEARDGEDNLATEPAAMVKELIARESAIRNGRGVSPITALFAKVSKGKKATGMKAG